MNPSNDIKRQPKLLWPGRKGAIRRILLIALVLFPLTWIADAFLVGTWDPRENGTAEGYRHITQALVIFVGVTCIVFLISLLPTSRRFSDWLFSARIVRRGLIALAWVVTIVALFYGEEDWRGRRGWNKYREAAEARGEELDLKAYTPKPIPDADNFAAIPEIQSWFIPSTNVHRGIEFTNNQWSGDNFDLAEGMVSIVADKNPWQMTDLAAWQRAFEAVRAGHTNANENFASGKLDEKSRAEAAHPVLDALRSSDGPLEQLRGASQRSDCVYPVIYTMDNPWGIFLPHLANIKAACLRLDLRACAELAAGQSDQALDDVKLMLRLSDSLRSEPFLISYLVRLAVFRIAMHPVWEGLATQRWSDAQLQEIQKLTQRYDFLAELEHPLHAERAAGLLTADLLANGKFRFTDLIGESNPGSKAANVFGRAAPHGWYEMEKLSYCRLSDLQMDGALDAAQSRVFPERIESNSNALDQAFAGREPFTTIFTRHQLLSVMILPALAKIPERAALAQATADQATIACGLERYRMAHGKFPEKLEDLKPDFIAKLPHDVITGEPYKYHPPTAQSSQFVLYSVGWNEKDDGGQVVSKGQKANLEQGDWVWNYAPQ